MEILKVFTDSHTVAHLMSKTTPVSRRNYTTPRDANSKGDRYDNAMAESQFALFKTELIRKRCPWRSVEQVELATLEWVWWFNNQRLHSEIGNVPPVEIEQAYYAEKDTVLAAAIHGNT